MSLDKKDMLAVMVAGLVGVALAPVILPTIVRLGRPVAKSALKAALLLQQQARERGAVFIESMEDLLAEAQAELAAEATEAQMAAVVPTAVKDS
jgi:hypothetical protein